MFGSASFPWTLPANGFRIANPKDVGFVTGGEYERPHGDRLYLPVTDSEWVLIDDGRPGPSASPRSAHEPIDPEGSTFLDFSALDASKPEQVIAFANRYGMAGLGDVATIEGKPRFLFETAQGWHLRLAFMKQIVSVWNLYTSGQFKALRMLFCAPEWADTFFLGLMRFGPDGKADKTDVELLRRAAAEWTDEQVASQAAYFMRDSINGQLRASVAGPMRFGGSPIPTPHAFHPEGTFLQLGENPLGGPGSLQVVCRTLYTALWVQFAASLAKGTEHRRCVPCGSWFKVSGDRRKARKEFCSDKCKARNYRTRRDRAIELQADGMDTKGVAEKLKAEGLETDLATVRKWTRKKGKG